MSIVYVVYTVGHDGIGEILGVYDSEKGAQFVVAAYKSVHEAWHGVDVKQVVVNHRPDPILLATWQV